MANSVVKRNSADESAAFVMWLSTAVGTMTSPGSKLKKARFERVGLFCVYRLASELARVKLARVKRRTYRVARCKSYCRRRLQPRFKAARVSRASC